MKKDTAFPSKKWFVLANDSYLHQLIRQETVIQIDKYSSIQDTRHYIGNWRKRCKGRKRQNKKRREKNCVTNTPRQKADSGLGSDETALLAQSFQLQMQLLFFTCLLINLNLKYCSCFMFVLLRRNCFMVAMSRAIIDISVPFHFQLRCQDLKKYNSCYKARYIWQADSKEKNQEIGAYFSWNFSGSVSSFLSLLVITVW